MSVDPRFLVLGSNSFSGASFCAFLSARGYPVLATSRSPEAHTAFLPYKWQKNAAGIQFRLIDINRDLDALDEIIRTERPTHVVNFAAQSMVAESWQNPDHWMTTNVASTVRLHERLRRLEHLERYVHVTTPEVYGSTEGWVTEDHPLNPSTPYAVSRAAADMSLRTYFTQYGFPVVSTRAANVYGPGQRLYRIVPRTIAAAQTGNKLRLDGGGASVRCFIHIDDTAAATLKIALEGRLGETYHISGTRPVTIRDLVKVILERMGKEFDACVEIGPERQGKDSAYLLSSEKLRRKLGWTDEISLEHGIDTTIAWAQRFRDVLPSLPMSYEHKP